MDCTDIRANLSGFVDGELDAALRHEAERHLVDCAPCQARVAQAESLDRMLRDAARRWGREDALPGSLVEDVLAHTVADVRALRAARRTAVFGWLAAAAAFGVATVLWFTGHWQAPASSSGSSGALADGRSSPDRRPDPAADGNIMVDRGSSSSGSAGSATEPGDGTLASENGADRDLEDLRAVETVAAESDSDREAALVFAMHGPPTWRSLLNENGQSSIDAPEHPTHDLSAREALADDVQDAVDALFATSQLLRQLRMPATTALVDADQVRVRLEYDRLVDRLEAVDSLLGDGDGHRSVGAAASMLHRLQHSPVDADVLREIQIDLGRIPLPERLEEIAVELEGSTQA